MRIRTLIFLFFLSIIVGLLAYIMFIFFVPREPPGMGHGTGSQFSIWIPIFIVPVTFAIGLLAYLALFPEIEQKHPNEIGIPSEHRSLEAVMKVLKDDEKKVIELLMEAKGTMLQRDISRKSGFTRVKTHRILHRLSTRGIVTAEKYYNTYKITLTDWLLDHEVSES